MEYPHGTHVLVGQKVLEGTYMLADLDEASPVGAAEVAEPPRRSQVHLVDNNGIDTC